MRVYLRELEKVIKKQLFKGKAIIVVGPRQTGKTTLIKKILTGLSKNNRVKTLNCDITKDKSILEEKNLEFLEKVIGDSNILFIDEGQKVPDIGTTLKILVDHFGKKLQIFVTGSSSINLLDLTQEFLTGRKRVYKLYPLSLSEIYSDKDILKMYKELEQLLIFGTYPEIIKQKSFSQKIEFLEELASSYLYKDLLELQQIKNPEILQKLLKALALQVSQEVSYNELSSLLGIDKATVERYVYLLEKCFVIFRLPSYSQNKRKEISRLRKIYFYDLGIRNALIGNFNFIDSRDDVGKLFENFMILERLKYREYRRIFCSQYFWRTYDGSEVDLVEEREGKLFGFEFKWGTKKHARKPIKFLEYKDSSFKTITKDNLIKFVL